MSQQIKPIPEGYHTVTPYLVASDAVGLIDFLQRAFGAKQVERVDRTDGAVMHAEVQMGDSRIMLSQACEQMGPMPTTLYHYVENSDAVYKQAMDAGGESIMAPTDMFWGDHVGAVKDPCGNVWWISTHIEDVGEEEIQQRAKAYAEQA